MIQDTNLLERADNDSVSVGVGHDPGTQEDLRAIEAAGYRSIFETPEFRTVYGSTVSAFPVIRIDVAEGPPLVFHDCGDHAICLARTAWLDQSTIACASKALFDLARIQFVVFEDIHVEPQFSGTPRWLSFHYQNDWIVWLDKSKGGLGPSFLRQMDRKVRRMKRELPDIRLTLELKPSRELVEAAIEFNRARVEASGGRYSLGVDEQERVVDTLSRIGIASVMRHGDQLVAAIIFVECGQDAYVILMGHNDSYRKVSPGMQVSRFGIEHFESRGFRAVHYLWGDSGYKAWLGAQRIPLTTLIVPRTSIACLSPTMCRVACGFGYLHLRRIAKNTRWVGAGTQSLIKWMRQLRANRAESDRPA